MVVSSLPFLVCSSDEEGKINIQRPTQATEGFSRQEVRQGELL